MAAVGRNLVERRVPHYLAAYLGGSWGLIEFVAFLEDRFLFSPYWTDLILLTLLLLLPSVALFIYFHGRPGADSWHRAEKVAIPANVLFTVVVLFAVFGGKDLGAMTTMVRVEDEDGNNVERVMVKSEFRKTLALFTPYADTTDAETAWLGPAVFAGLANDLAQDMFLSVRPWLLFRNRVREAGFRSDAAMPRPLKRSMSAESHVPYFVDGEVARAGDGYRITLALNDTDRGQVVADRVYEGDDLFALIDSASIQLRRDLDLPTRHLEETTDLPVTDHLTGSMEALRHYALGLSAVIVDTDFETGVAELQAALEADPTFADAAFSLYQVDILRGDVGGAVAALQTTMDNLYRLPERAHYAVKGEWYAIHQDFAKSFAVYEMWTELYPQDISAHEYAAQMRTIRDDREGVIRAYETILELDPTRIELLPRIGAAYEAMGNPDEARRTYERHLAAAPEDVTSMTALARLHRRSGDHDAARELYERAELLQPSDVGIVTALASLDRDAGRFDDAVARYDAALAGARTAEQRYALLSALSAHYRARGAMDRALDYGEQALEEAAAFMPPLNLTQIRLLNLEDYVHAGHSDEALALLDELLPRLQPPLDALAPIGKMVVYEALDRPDGLESAVAEGQALMERRGLGFMGPLLVYFGGRVHEMRGEWQDAIAAFQREREASPTDAGIPMQLGRCYRELGELGRAEGLILETLKVRPSDGRAHYELALVYEDMGRIDDAVDHLEQALHTWAPADDDFTWAQRASEALARLRPAI